MAVYQRYQKKLGFYITTDVKVGNKCAQIILPDQDDGRFSQWVDLKPKTTYKLSGWIKTEKVVSDYQGVKAGATLTIEIPKRAWPQICSTPFLGNRDWKKVSVKFFSDNYTGCYVQARLGYYSGNTTGIAWFDGLEFIEVLKY